ncbi:unnamed protein product, partial [Mesorhabditis spiculigera]
MAAKHAAFAIIAIVLYTQGTATPIFPSTTANTPENNDVFHNVTSPPLDIDKELKNIAGACFNYSDLDKILDHALKPGVGGGAAWLFLHYSVYMIGLQEMRAELGFTP